MGPSSLFREEFCPVCSGPLIPLERGGLPGVQWAPPPSWERGFTQCAVGPSSILREEVYPLGTGPSSLLREEVYPVCSEPLLPLERGGLYLLCSGPFIPLERGGLPSVQWALRPFWERRFTQCGVGPSSLLRAQVYLVCPSSLLRKEVYPVCSGPLLPLERGGLPSVQWALYPSWKRTFTECAVGP